MVIENPYDWNTHKLLDEFMNACGRAGLSNSGLVIDLAAGSQLSWAQLLRGVVLARIEGAKPPFRPGDRVCPKVNPVAPARTNRWNRSTRPRHINTAVTIQRVLYCGESRWELVFYGQADEIADKEWDMDEGCHYWHSLRFRAEDFAGEARSQDAGQQSVPVSL